MRDYAFFLGGRDLEMVTIRQLLADSGQANVFDHAPTWGASASQYRELIVSQLNAGRVIVLIELGIDFDVLCQAGNDTSKVVIIDHHNERAGRDSDTSLNQVFSLLQLPKTSGRGNLNLWPQTTEATSLP